MINTIFENMDENRTVRETCILENKRNDYQMINTIFKNMNENTERLGRPAYERLSNEKNYISKYE